MTSKLLKTRKWIVGSITPQDGVHMSTTPFVHISERAARDECVRLAKANPDKTFIYFQSIGMCQSRSVIWDETNDE